MTITRTVLSEVASTSNTQSYNSTTASPSANALLVAYFVNTAPVGTGRLSTAVVANTPWGLSWNNGPSNVYNTDELRLSVFYATTGGSAPGADTFDIDCTSTGLNQTGAITYLVEYTDSSGTAPTLEQVLADSGTTTAPLHDTMASFGGASWGEAFFTTTRNPANVTPDTGWTEAADSGYSGPSTGYWVIHSNGTTSDNTPSGTWGSGDVDWLAVGIEVAEPSAGDTVTGIVLNASPSLPTATLRANVTGVVLNASPSLPAATLRARLTGVVLDASPSLPAATSYEQVTGVVLNASPSLPAAVLQAQLTGVVLTAGASVPAAVLQVRPDAVTLDAAPSLPVATLRTNITGVVLDASPSLPAANIGATDQIDGAVLDAAPSLPQAGMQVTLTGVVLDASPSLPAGAAQARVTAIVLDASPELPAAGMQETVDAIALDASPDLPAGVLTVQIAGIVLNASPSLPSGAIEGQEAEAAASAFTFFFRRKP